MYVPDAFREQQQDKLCEFIREFPFATLVTAHGGLQATHIPLLLDAPAANTRSLRGHVARANPHWRSLDAVVDAVAIFLGPHAYVSPQWYPSKQTGGNVVPTWNYAAVHVHGRLRAVSDRAWLRENVAALTAQQESSFETPWSVSDAPPDYLEMMLDAVVGVELEIASLTGKFKLSQNRTPADREGVRRGLKACPNGQNAAVAALMEVR